MSHTVVSVVLVKVGFTITFKVAKESQPVELTNVAVWEEAPLKVNPFQSKGSSVSHTVVSVVLNKVLFTDKFKVAKESQPVTKLVKLAVWLSDPLNVNPFQSKGRSLSQIVRSVLLVKVGFTITFKVAKESQPVTTLVKVEVSVPAPLNVNPFQSKGSSVSHTVVSVCYKHLTMTTKEKV